MQDLVRQELPLLEAHLAEMGVEVAAVSFAWFLSLFTDCRGCPFVLVLERFVN